MRTFAHLKKSDLQSFNFAHADFARIERQLAGEPRRRLHMGWDGSGGTQNLGARSVDLGTRAEGPAGSAWGAASPVC